MIDGMDAAERLGLPADPDEETLNYVTLGLPSLLASTMWLSATRRILAVRGRGRWSLNSRAGYSQPRFRKSPLSASCRAEALARDADRNHSDEVLGFGLYPRLKANVADRRTLGLGIHVMRRAPH
jgi:hypothetical protein